MATPGDAGVGIPGEEEGEKNPDIVKFFGTGETPGCTSRANCVENLEVLCARGEGWVRPVLGLYKKCSSTRTSASIAS